MKNMKEIVNQAIARMIARRGLFDQKTGAFTMPVSAQISQTIEREQLKNAYLNTTYRIFDPKIDIRIGEENTALGEFLSQIGHTDWAFLTASNPDSKELSPEENGKRNEMLLNDLKLYRIFKGEGRGDDTNWNPEESVLAIGIHREVAVFLGRKYEQRAIVVGVGSQTELVMLN